MPALFADEFGNRHTEQFAHITTGNHLLKALFTGFFGAGVVFGVETIGHDFGKVAALQIENHAAEPDAFGIVNRRFKVAGVVSRGVD